MKGKQKGAKRGYDLLKKKADALTMRFRAILKEILVVRNYVNSLKQRRDLLYSRTKRLWARS